MPIGVCAADLAESNDPRERRAGARNPYRTHHGIQQGKWTMIPRIAIPSGAHPWIIVYMVAERITKS